VVGESGFGKTYTICCLIGELAQQRVVSIVIDYGQGFLRNSLPAEFVTAVNPIEILASREGININPLQIFPTDLLGPVNVAQRIADTFARVYPRIGVQQHMVLRRAVLELFSDEGIVVENMATWKHDPPAFAKLQLKLEALANNSTAPYSRYAASAVSHVSTIFVFNTFRSNGLKMSWREIMGSNGGVFVIQLKGLESSLECAVTEFLLWNLIGYIETLGPSPLHCFVVLDEAHKLSFGVGSPVEKLLREGRKFGTGLILASQQPDDFSPVAFANTATKIVFQVADDHNIVSRQLYRKLRKSHSFSDVHEFITKLPRGCSYVVSENVGKSVKIASIPVRAKRWKLRR
jgi:DNA phosphorothioation-dependent restriction protein DptH